MRTYILRPSPPGSAGASPRNAAPKPAAPLKPIPAARHAEDGQCPDGSWKPLSNEQKKRLAILARQAAVACGISSHEADEWRREQSILACGLRITEATQKHWADLKSRFEDLGGRPEKAFQTQMREGDNKRRIAMWKLTQALTAKGLQPEYAGKICRAQFKCQLEEASAKQLWCLFYTVTNRQKTGRQKTEDRRTNP